MTEWRACELGDICSRLSSGKSISAKMISKEGTYPVYGGNGIRGYTSTPNFKGQCAVIGRQGAFCGNVRYFDGEAYMTEHAVVVCADNNNCTRYLAFLLSTMNLGRLSGQSAQPGLSVKTLSKQKIQIPPKEIQIKCAELLGKFDEKIKNNMNINENLLQQARALFRQWFSVTSSGLYKLSDIADINPETYSPKENWSFVNYLDTSNITSGTINEVQYIIPSEEKLPSRARRILRKDDIVFSTVRPNQLHYGIISNPKPNMLGSTGFAVIRSKYATMPNEIIYLALTESAFVEQMQQLAEQSVSTFPSIRPADLDACVLPEPKEDDNDFMETIKAIFNAVATNNEENQQLATLRDTLLPRLMSGELDVSSLDF